MHDWTLHIISDKLLVLSAGRNVPRDLCREITAQLKPRIADLDVEILVFWDVSVEDHRDIPAQITDAFRIADDWLTEHA